MKTVDRETPDVPPLWPALAAEGTSNAERATSAIINRFMCIALRLSNRLLP